MNQKERVRLAEQKILAMEKQRELLQDYEGKVVQLDENNYLENVESKGKGTNKIKLFNSRETAWQNKILLDWTSSFLLVVLLLYDVMNENSAVLNKSIDILAEKIPHVRFCRAEYQNIAQSCSRYLVSFHI